MLSLLGEILEFNHKFVDEKKYEPYRTSKYPDRKFVVVTCMDTRLIELLPASMAIKNGDAKILKTAGAVVSHPFGSLMRSILVAVYELKAEEVIVAAHYDCGMGNINPRSLIQKFRERGIQAETLRVLEASGVDVEKWLKGFNSVEDNVRSSVSVIRNHPLLPSIPVHGLVMDPDTGRLDLIEDGYVHLKGLEEKASTYTMGIPST